MTVGQAVAWARRNIEDISGGDATADARMFVCEVAGVAVDQMLMNLNKPLQGKQEARLRDMVARRVSEREPAQYIVGSVYFLGHRLRCDPRALIPRFETEMLAMEAYRAAQGNGLTSVLDLCTGSGCIAVSLALMGLTASACDDSEDALMLARENAKALGAEVAFYHGDLFAALPEGTRFDMVVSNPPYVASQDLGGLPPEIRGHEPHRALDGGEDGLLFYRRIAAEALTCLRPGGWLLLEIGQGQGEAVIALLAPEYEAVEILPDMRGIPRVVRARRKEEDAG